MRWGLVNAPIIFDFVCSGLEAASVAWYPLGWRAAWLGRRIDATMRANFVHEREIARVA